MKIFTAFGILKFHIIFQTVLIFPAHCLELLVLRKACKSFSIWYALLTEKIPFGVPRQMRESLACPGLKAVWQVMWASSIWKISLMRREFHHVLSVLILCGDWIENEVGVGNDLWSRGIHLGLIIYLVNKFREVHRINYQLIDF